MKLVARLKWRLVAGLTEKLVQASVGADWAAGLDVLVRKLVWRLVCKFG